MNRVQWFGDWKLSLAWWFNRLESFPPVAKAHLSCCFRDNIVEISGQFPIGINQWINNTNSVLVAIAWPGNLHWKKKNQKYAGLVFLRDNPIPTKKQADAAL